MKITSKWGILIVAMLLMALPLLAACSDDEDGADSETVSNLEGKVTALEQGQTSLEAKITALESTIGGLESAIEDLEEAIEDLGTPPPTTPPPTTPPPTTPPPTTPPTTTPPPTTPPPTTPPPTTPPPTTPPETTTPPSGNVVGTSWVYTVTYDCDEIGVSGNQLIVNNETSWTMTVSGMEDLDGIECYVTESQVEGDAERRYPYPGGVTPAMDVPVMLAPTGKGPTVHRSMETKEMLQEMFPLRANAMGGINLDVARSYAYPDGRSTEINVGDTWTYTSQVDLDNFLFHESMTWTAEVEAIESVTVPMGTFDCYKIAAAGTGGENPDKTNYFWWAVDEDFVCPVKYQYNYIFLGSETHELTAYTPAS